MAHAHHHMGTSAMDHGSTPASPHQPAATPGPHSHGSSADASTMMPMTFYFGYKNMELLFAGLAINSAVDMALAFVTVFLLGVGYEGLMRACEELLRKTQEGLRAQFSPFPRPYGTYPKERSRQRLLSAGHLLQTALHVLQVTLSNLLMLIVMTYNAYLGLAVLTGTGAGYWLFGWKKAEHLEPQNRDMNVVELYETGSGNGHP